MSIIDGEAFVTDSKPPLAEVFTTTALVASGVISGIGCLVVFLALHAIWITPIWNVAVIGVFIASGGCAVTAWCCAMVRRMMPVRPLSWFAVFGMVAVPLVPCVILTAVLPPLLQSENGELVHPINVPWLVTGFFVNLLFPAAAVGATMGWLIARKRSAAALFAGMGLLMALGPGHNLPLFGVFGDATGPQLLKVFMLTFVPMAVAAVALSETMHWFASKRLRYMRELSVGIPKEPSISRANKTV